MTTIAIVGATGFTGSNLVKEALSRGEDVIAVARDTSSLQPADHLVIRTGDVFDLEFVDKLAKDADVIVIAIPSRELDGNLLADSISDIGEVTAKHQTRLGVIGGAASLFPPDSDTRLIDRDDFPDEWRPEAEAAFRNLVALQDTLDEVDWFFVSPSEQYGRGLDIPERGTYRLGADTLLVEKDGTSSIAGGDFARAVIDEVESPVHYRERFTVGY